MHNCCCERQSLLRQIQAHDFALVDLVLYLDSHPTCQRALAHYQKHKAMRDAVAVAYTNKFGPLTHPDAAASGRWDWVCNPWPWELEG